MVINTENQELNEKMASYKGRSLRRGAKESNCEPSCGDCPPSERTDYGKLSQWTTGDGKRFLPAGITKEQLPPGVYEIHHSACLGLYFEKIPVRTEGLLRFPQTNSERVLKEIEIFWDREKLFTEFGITYKRGIILWGPPGCHAKGTLIRMFDGSVKRVEDVLVGDELMGPDSKLRKVLGLKRGREELYKIVPTKGETFVVNANHVLHLELEGSSILRRRSRSKEKLGMYYTRKKYRPLTIDVTVSEYLAFSKTRRELYKLKYTTGVEFNDFQDALPVDPYFLGIWLGDGSKHLPHITNKDSKIVEFVYEYAEQRGLEVRVDQPGDSDCPTYALVARDRLLGGRSYNCLQNDLRSLNLLNNKHIPLCYLRSSRETRLLLLAGLIDTDGHYNCSIKGHRVYKGFFEITQKSQQLAEDIVSLARSLGFLATIRPVRKTIKKIGFSGTYYRVNICGDLSCIPVRIGYKQGGVGNPNKDNLRTGIKEITPVGTDDYYGFELSDDHLYLTSDYIIHHNSGKTCTVNLIMKDVVDRNGVVIKFTNPGLFIEGMRVLREIQSVTPIVVLMEDIDSIIEHYEESPVLNILDGVESVSKIVFLATTNYPETLGPRIINRPSRFDKRFKIPYPNVESRMMYFKHLCGTKKPEELKIDIKKWVKDTEDFSIAHLKELFVAVIILGDEYAEALENLSKMKEKISSSEDIDKLMGFKR